MSARVNKPKAVLNECDLGLQLECTVNYMTGMGRHCSVRYILHTLIGCKRQQRSLCPGLISTGLSQQPADHPPVSV